MKKSLWAKFWSKVDVTTTNECWEWIGKTKNNKGRGRIFVNGKQTIPARFSWELVYGKIPDGLCVCHTCDNGRCCNPSHLWLGTHKDNMQDMFKKGRYGYPRALGEKNGQAKLTPDQVKQIRWEKEHTKITYRALAKKYDMSHATIEQVVHRTTWKNIKVCIPD